MPARQRRRRKQTPQPADPPAATPSPAAAPLPWWRTAVGQIGTALLAFVLGVASTVLTTYLSGRVTKATQPQVLAVGQTWPSSYYLSIDPGLNSLIEGQPQREPSPAAAEDYFDRLDRFLRGKGALPKARSLTITVTNSQNEPITVKNLQAEVTRREKISFGAQIGDNTGGPIDTTLHFDLSKDRAPGILQCGDEGCALSNEAQEIQRQASYFGTVQENIAAGESRNYNALLDGDNLLVSFRFKITVIALDTHGDRTARQITIRDLGGQDFRGVSGRTGAAAFYTIDGVNGGITKTQ
ncbi:hypothetical protein GCM10010435_47550 [Winogradskya consettensis]|uniref:Uncharacterized protein n=1 Tax=Winogradskya consettensis TaxID=113560 RepID=A0A919VNL1_9ACTN|nr:hypothetical protein [Actinoplanes consettensis]GIM72894.1 hypothetical protein Aco04nite_32480 [Actinoplanes consettensis]